MQRLALEERNKRVCIWQDVNVFLGVDDRRFAFREGNVCTERTRRELPFRDRERNVSEVETELKAEHLQKFIALDEDRENVIILRHGDERAQIARENVVEKRFNVERQFGNFHFGEFEELPDKRECLFGVDLYFDAVHIEKDVPVCIGEGNRLLHAVQSERKIARKRAIRKRNIQPAVYGKPLARIRDIRTKRLARQNGSERLDMRHEVGIGRLVALGELGGSLFAVGKDDVRLDALRRDVRGDILKRGVPILERKRKVDGKGDAAQRELGRKGCARLVVGELPLPELRKERVKVEAALIPFRSRRAAI